MSRTKKTTKTASSGLTRSQSQVTQTIQLTIEPTRCEIIQTDSTGRRTTAIIGANGAALSTSCRKTRESARINGSPSLAEINAAYRIFEPFLGHEPTQKVGSYLLKHLCERHLAKRGLYVYISNGACQVAAAQAGFVQHFDPQSINSVVRAPVGLLRELGEKTQRRPTGSVPIVTVDQASQLRAAASEA